MSHLLEKRDRIEAAHKRVRRIVLNTEVRRVDLLDDLQKDVLGLGELRVSPRAVLVVILHTQHNVPSLGILERAADALQRARDAFLAREPRMPLATERAAMAGTQTNGQIDGGLLPIDLALPLLRIRVGKVRREADHGRFLSCRSDQARDWIDIDGRQTTEKPVVMLDPFPAQSRGVLNPLLERNFLRHEFVELKLRENADAWRHFIRKFISWRRRASIGPGTLADASAKTE